MTQNDAIFSQVQGPDAVGRPPNMECKVPGGPKPEYWNARPVAAAIHRRFESQKAERNVAGMRQQFYVLAHYYGRTLGILRQALVYGNASLIEAALDNLLSLHRPLHHMHDLVPFRVPFVLTLGNETRKSLVRDLIIKALKDAGMPLKPADLSDRVNRLNFLAEVPAEIFESFLADLAAGGYLEPYGAAYSLTRKVYHFTDLDRQSLRALLGDKLYDEFVAGGFPDISSVAYRKADFYKFFKRFGGCGRDIADHFISVASEVLGPASHAPELHAWNHADLIGSLHPRPYQYAAYSLFRSHGYQSKVIEAPAGSGKTMIGMMCIQDWLRTLAQGEAILVLVPTVNYRQQWLSELSLNPIGLRLAPEAIFAGSPSALRKKISGAGPGQPVLIMTYTALAGMNADACRELISSAGVNFVVLDEVHKVADDPRSPSARIARTLSAMVRRGELKGLIGFSGTATDYEGRLEDIGLDLIYSMPATDLIAYGFIAPFAEFGIPFTHSDREAKIRELLDDYKGLMRRYIELIEPGKLAAEFERIPATERLFIGKYILYMYDGHADQEEKLTARFESWTSIESVNLTHLPVLLIVQIALNYSDETLFQAAGRAGNSEERFKTFREIVASADAVRQRLRQFVGAPDIKNRLFHADFGHIVHLRGLVDGGERQPLTRGGVKDALASTVFGLYLSLRELYYRMGEGHIESIKAVIDAELRARKVSGIIIFDTARSLPDEGEPMTAQYSGLGGLFFHMLGEGKFVPMAATSSEVYLPWSDGETLTERIGRFVKDDIMFGEIGASMFELAVRDVRMPKARLETLRDLWNDLLKRYITGLSDLGAARPAEFHRMVVSRFRRSLKDAAPPAARRILKARLSARNQLLSGMVASFFNYGLIAWRFLKARPETLESPEGVRHRLFKVKMPSDERKQLMYELLSRVVNDEDMPVNVIVVSTWARTGWNVFTPNVLIDATATRDATAWRQLRGRALRAPRSWNADCSELLMHILGSYLDDMSRVESAMQSDAVLEDKLWQEFHVRLDPTEKKILEELAVAALRSGDRGLARLARRKVEKLRLKDKERLAVALLASRNKVTHIYEMVKAYGSSPQVMYDRAARKWVRSGQIARKHSREYSVAPFSGAYLTGEGHAPLVYEKTPRKDHPSQIGALLRERLGAVDRKVVMGWVQTLTSQSDVGSRSGD